MKRVEFYGNNVLVGTGTKIGTTDYTLTLTNVAAGAITYEARGFDKNRKASAAVSVTVAPGIVPNLPPTISLSASPNTNLIAPASTTLSAFAADSDGAIARVEFYVNGGKVVEDVSPPYSHSLLNLAAGTHTVSAIAIDDALVVDESVRGLRQRLLRHTGGDRLLLEVGEEAVERHAVMAGRAAARGGGWSGRCSGWSR